jgi:uncharacterized protein
LLAGEVARGNIEGVSARLHEEVEWIEPGGGNSPSGAFRGPDSVRDDVFANVPANFDEFTVTVVEARDEGDMVVIKSHFEGSNKSGAKLDADAEQVWEIRDDQETWSTGWS